MAKQLIKTKEQIAYELLKNLIIQGELPKNQFLSQRMLAERVNTNLSTIRTVLRHLESDHLIENIPRWGVRIPIETEDVVRDRYYVRELLEVGAVRLIIEKRNTKDVDGQLLSDKAKICDAIAEESTKKNIDKYAEAHLDFHLELAKQSGSPLLLESLSRVHFQGLILKNAIRGWVVPTNHFSLVDAILHGDEATALDLMIKHVRYGFSNELHRLHLELDRNGLRNEPG